MSERRTEPPFDGKPCPMCPSAWRNFSACVHNFLGEFERNGQSDRAVRKFWYVHEAVNQLAPTIDDTSHPLLKAAWEAANAATARVQLESSMMRARDAMRALRAAYEPIKALSEAHFEHRSHSHGD